ncbi:MULTISPECIES: Cro/CI family transcriptional regulator [unclassified Serratia (in: enterobacteria)]|uniref:Cro/CI family transcriptional regulator n=1 Tax=unclassified Serratia (in: enterobacteria) TaxID=2647522 RepID=UPI003B42E1EA
MLLVPLNQVPIPIDRASVFVAENGEGFAHPQSIAYQSAISKALKSKRNITVLVHDSGMVEAEELRPFPSLSAKRK